MPLPHHVETCLSGAPTTHDGSDPSWNDRLPHFHSHPSSHAPVSHADEAAYTLLKAIVGDSSTSIFSMLSRVLSLHDPTLPPLSCVKSTDDLSTPSHARALRPHHELNHALRTLVSILVSSDTETQHIRNIDASSLSTDDRASSSSSSTGTDTVSAAAVVHAAENILRSNPTLAARANAIRAVAATAERELELDSVEKYLASSLNSNQHSQGLANETSFTSNTPYDGNQAFEDLSICQDDCVGGLTRFFPYVDNYELLVRGETSILQAHLPAQSPLATDASTSATSGFLKGKTVAFCGSGPLPLTGILMHARSGARVVLVDLDRTALDASKLLIERLACHGLVDTKAFEYVLADAGALKYRRTPLAQSSQDHETNPIGQRTTSGDYVFCDAVVLASLLPHTTRMNIVKDMASASEAPKLENTQSQHTHDWQNGGQGLEPPSVLLVRSAVGLVAELAYCKVPVDELSEFVTHVGEYVPRRCIDLVDASGELGTSRTSNVIGTLDSGVLNSVQVYTPR